jgi:hypothetical protein
MNPLRDIEEKLKNRFAQRDALDREICDLQEAKRLLSPYFDAPVTTAIETSFNPPDMGITDAVREAVRLSGSRMLTAIQIRDIVASRGFDLSKYNNAMATVHQIIKRLVDSEEIEGPLPRGNEKVFRWRGEREAPAIANKPVSNDGPPLEGQAWVPKRQAISLLGMCDRSFDRFVKEGKIERRRGVAEGRFVYRRNDIERIALMRKEVVSSRQK